VTDLDSGCSRVKYIKHQLLKDMKF